MPTRLAETWIAQDARLGHDWHRAIDQTSDKALTVLGWTSRWFIVPALMLATVLAWLLYVGQHDNGLIEGRVVDAQGRPVPGATIRIFDRGFVTHQERGRITAVLHGSPVFAA